MLIPTVPLWEIVLRTALVYLAVLGVLRLAGKREMGQMSLANFVVILVIANAVQNASNGSDPPLTGGLASAVTLVGPSYLLDRFGRRVPFLGRLVSGEPTLLLQDGVSSMRTCDASTSGRHASVTTSRQDIAPRVAGDTVTPRGR